MVEEDSRVALWRPGEIRFALFPEPWRAIALQGAELVLLPIWGGNEKLLPARATENHLFIVTSGYNMRSCVVDPVGEILSEATAAAPVVTAEVHLDRKIYQDWIGDMSTRTWKERRGDLPCSMPWSPAACCFPLSSRPIQSEANSDTLLDP